MRSAVLCCILYYLLDALGFSIPLASRHSIYSGNEFNLKMGDKGSDCIIDRPSNDCKCWLLTLENILQLAVISVPLPSSRAPKCVTWRLGIDFTHSPLCTLPITSDHVTTGQDRGSLGRVDGVNIAECHSLFVPLSSAGPIPSPGSRMGLSPAGWVCRSSWAVM